MKLFFVLVLVITVLLFQAVAGLSFESSALDAPANVDEGNGGIDIDSKHLHKKINCNKACSVRCKKSSRKNVCHRACKTCCSRCGCVPPGTYGNQNKCPCYAKLRTHGNKLKCP